MTTRALSLRLPPTPPAPRAARATLKAGLQAAEQRIASSVGRIRERADSLRAELEADAERET